MGYLPMLDVDGKKICESMAILRYIAREIGIET
jgi:glutathione S-transferase